MTICIKCNPRCKSHYRRRSSSSASVTAQRPAMSEETSIYCIANSSPQAIPVVSPPAYSSQPLNTHPPAYALLLQLPDSTTPPSYTFFQRHLLNDIPPPDYTSHPQLPDEPFPPAYTPPPYLPNDTSSRDIYSNSQQQNDTFTATGNNHHQSRPRNHSSSFTSPRESSTAEAASAPSRGTGVAPPAAEKLAPILRRRQGTLRSERQKTNSYRRTNDVANLRRQSEDAATRETGTRPAEPHRRRCQSDRDTLHNNMAPPDPTVETLPEPNDSSPRVSHARIHRRRSTKSTSNHRKTNSADAEPSQSEDPWPAAGQTMRRCLSTPDRQVLPK